MLERVVQTLRFSVDPANPDRLTLPWHSLLATLVALFSVSTGTWLFLGLVVPMLGRLATSISGRAIEHHGKAPQCEGSYWAIAEVCVRARGPCPCVAEGFFVCGGLALALIVAWVCATATRRIARACKSPEEIVQLRLAPNQVTLEEVE